MSLLGIGVSGLQVSQTALQVTGNNITNASSPSYSRQRVDLGTRPEQLQGSGFLGAGAIVTGIGRVIEQFLVTQIQRDTATFNSLDSFFSNIGQLDSLLATEFGGIGDSISNFYSAIESSAEDPTSKPARQVVLSASESLVQSLGIVYDRIELQNQSVNEQMKALTGQVTSLASGIAQLNQAIEEELGRGQGAQPSQLLDERDKLLKELSEIISVETVTETSGSINVFVGNGQSLVVGARASVMDVQASLTEPNNFNIVFSSSTIIQDITSLVSGGKLGGLVEFRDDVINEAFNAVGRIALGITDTLNQQNSQGLDLEGNFGGDIFLDINAGSQPGERVVVNSNNVLAADRNIDVVIDDIGQLSTSDYTLLLFDDGVGGDLDYQLIRLSDNTSTVGALTLPLTFPETITSADGFTINLNSGSFQAGDSYSVRPTRFGARDMDVQMTRLQELAFASPIVTDADLGNVGTGVISQGDIIEILNGPGDPFDPAAADPLNPPLLIRFTSATDYTVFDYSNPAVPAVQFTGTIVPGLSNKIFLDAPGALPQYTGYQVEITGLPALGDEFTIGYNSNSTSDNRNAVRLGETRTTDILEGSTLSFEDAFGALVEDIGSRTAQADISRSASESLLAQAQFNRDSVSGVNLDEEAANLIKFEQAYNASAQVINVARQIFDTLLAAFS